MDVLWCYGIICIYGIFLDLRFKISGFADARYTLALVRTLPKLQPPDI
jgi:hypothetical protein